jgi:hypothetical protein
MKSIELFLNSMTSALCLARSGDRATARDFAGLARLHALGKTGFRGLAGAEYERAERLLAGLDGALDITGCVCGSNLSPVKRKVWCKS